MNRSYPKRTHYAKDLPKSPLGTKVTVAGWVEDTRPLGSILFLIIRDPTGICQTILGKKNTPPDVFEAAKTVPRQSFVAIEGRLKQSKAEKVPIEVEVESLQILAPADLQLPIDPTGRVPSSIDIRLDSRALDLRDPTIKAVFLIRHTALQSIRKTLLKEGFTEVNTSKLIGQATEGGAALFSFDYFGRKAYLAQSPQLYKEQLTLSLDRVFEIAYYYRAEKSHTRRHLNEFLSVDIEAAMLDEEEVMKICEKMVRETMIEVAESRAEELELLGHNLKIQVICDSFEEPFNRISYHDALQELAQEGVEIKFGEDLSEEALKTLGEKHPGFYFIVDWPVRLKPFYIEKNNEDPALSRGFDLQFGAVELASGGMRVFRKEDLKARLLEAGLDPKDFSHHLRCFDWGMPPHSGWGFGFDRFMMALTGRQNIREVVLHPRDQFRLEP
ncbi:MAG: aspartate--tRNA(Asn) ligase [Thaumarchaeota archaeon]|nr:aspartate--tRNA(Asn) ligase [Nitrososphaerota archaeon]